MANQPIYIDLASLSGVDSDTFRAADSGDRQAQKLMLRNLLTREASAEALTTGHWTDWVLRMIATGANQATSDALGSIAEAGRTGKITQAQDVALNELFEQYFGPGTVRSTTQKRVLEAFRGKHREMQVLELFLLADQLASGDSTVDPAAVLDAARRADALCAPGAASFFRAVWAQLTCADNALTAFEVALDAIKMLEPLAEGDSAYAVKLGQLALMASQIAEVAGEPQAGQLLRAVHAERIAQYRDSERDG
jgi:hypothetical protein